MPDPIYTVENVTPAYQLIYSLTVFWRSHPAHIRWLEELSSLTESDGIRILDHRLRDPTTSQFLVSTRPDVPPVRIPTRIKGRLQHLLKAEQPQPFRRNYDLISIGSTSGEKTESYVAGQVPHHLENDSELRQDFTDLQITNPEVDLRKPRFVRRGRCTCNLHLVLVHRDRRNITDCTTWISIRDIIRRWADAKECLLSRAGLLPDHLHVTFGLNPQMSPLDASLTLMNNVVWVHDMRPVLMDSFRVNTFGKYDLGAIRREMDGA